MTTKSVIALILLILGTSSLTVADRLFWVILGEVNASKPPGEQISIWWVHPLRFRALLDDYSRQYPGGRRDRQSVYAFVLGLLFCLAGIAVYTLF